MIKTKIIIAILSIILVLSVFFQIYTSCTRYVPVCELNSKFELFSSSDCTRINFEYTDNNTGKVDKFAITDTKEIDSFNEHILNTFCKKSYFEAKAGCTAVTITFEFENLDSKSNFIITTLSDGKIKIDNTYYKTNNLIGIYVMKVLQNKWHIQKNKFNLQFIQNKRSSNF